MSYLDHLLRTLPREEPRPGDAFRGLQFREFPGLGGRIVFGDVEAFFEAMAAAAAGDRAEVMRLCETRRFMVLIPDRGDHAS